MNPRKPSVTARCCPASGRLPGSGVPGVEQQRQHLSRRPGAVLRAAEELGYQVNFLARG